MTAVIYARYSSDNQREESIEGQIRECTAYAEKNGITIVKHYIDRAISAKTDNRPEFQQMIKDSDKKLFDIVLVWKLDRFARNRYDSARYKTQLKKNGVKLMSATEIISEGPEGIILEPSTIKKEHRLSPLEKRQKSHQKEMVRIWIALLHEKCVTTSAFIASKHLGTIRGQFEGCTQHIGSPAAHQHPLQENFKIFVHAANVGVDLQVQRDDLFLGVDFQGLVRYRIVDPVVDIERCLWLFPHTAAAHIGLVTDDERG